MVFGAGEHYSWSSSFVGILESAVQDGARDGTPRAHELHDLRRTAASVAVSAGANVEVVQRMLGQHPP
jgi:site-specific recombinase XerD